jgi:hypothetical protein
MKNTDVIQLMNEESSQGFNNYMHRRVIIVIWVLN